MGVATALVGLLPTYASIGVAAPIILITLRLLQGLGRRRRVRRCGDLCRGARAARPPRVLHELDPDHRDRGHGSVSRRDPGLPRLLDEQFETWGWRVPFLLSIILLCISVYIRLQLEESPVFREMRVVRASCRKRRCANRSARWSNLKLVLLALLGAMAGQAVVGYVALVYMNLFLTQTLKVDPSTSNLLVAGALASAARSTC